jgi:hypothetical protein
VNFHPRATLRGVNLVVNGATKREAASFQPQALLKCPDEREAPR